MIYSLSELHHRLTRLCQLPRSAGSSDFDLNPSAPAPSPAALTEAAVLILFHRKAAHWSVVLTKRASALKHHPGQIAFPGGKIDPGDASTEAAALREAREEIGLPSEQVALVGRLAPHRTVTGYSVTPVIGIAEGPVTFTPELGEVDRVFEVPAAHLMDASNCRIEGRQWQGVRRQYYVIPFGPHYIWGATARMLVALRANWDAVR